MRTLSAIVILVGLGFGAGCAQKPAAAPPVSEVLWGCHFIGTAQLAANTNTATLQRLAALPASQELREKILNKLAAAPLELFAPAGAAPAAASAALVRPLLDDWLRAESSVLAQGVTNQT